MNIMYYAVNIAALNNIGELCEKLKDTITTCYIWMKKRKILLMKTKIV